MSQNSLVLPTTGIVSGLQQTQNTNNALDTLNTLASGSSAPGSPEAGQLWHDTTNNILKLRSLDNSAWIALVNLNEGSYVSSPYYSSQINGDINRVVNPGMEVDQVNEGAAYTIPNNGTPTYTADQWQVTCKSSGAGSVSAQRNSTSGPAGLPYSLSAAIGSGAGSVGAGDYFYFSQPIEGFNVDDLNFGTGNALPISLSFWVKSTVAGSFSCALQNSANSRAIVYPFNIGSANVWQLVTLPNIPGDTTGSWAGGSNTGIVLYITAAAGSTFQTSTLGSWQGSGPIASTSQTNSILTTSGAYMIITGVQLTPGAFCLPFEKRTIQRELSLCERYFQKSFAAGTAVAQNAGTTGAAVWPQVGGASTSGCISPKFPFRGRMRVAATISTYNPSNTNAQIRNPVTGSDFTSTTAGGDDTGVYFLGVSPAGSALGNINEIHYTASARM